MIRDFDLIRKLLLAVEAAPPGVRPIRLTCPDGYDEVVVDAHLALLIEADLLDGRVQKFLSGKRNITVFDLTWEGHDFLDIARPDTLWARAKQITKEKSLPLTLEVLKEVLKGVAQGLLS